MTNNMIQKENHQVDIVKLPVVVGFRNWLKDVYNDIRQGRLMKYLPRALYLAFLGVLYIGNRHHIDRIIRRIDVLKLEVESLQADYMNAHATYMHMLKRTEIVKKARAIGLTESIKPPEVIFVER